MTAPGGAADAAPDRTRIDKWLWRARFFKTRALAAKAVSAGLRINGARSEKPGASVRVGDVLTFSKDDRVRVIEIAALGERRGPAPEARTLYVDRTPAPPPDAAPDAAIARDGRPDRRARAQARALRGRDT